MKLNEELEKLYYTASEARRILGIDPETFQYWGKTERVKRVYLPGRKHPVYSKQQVNKLANRIEVTMLAEKATGLEYRKATVNDLDAEVELASLVFGARAGLVEAVATRRAFLEKNPNTTYHLYDDDHLVAYINLIPITRSAAELFRDGTRGWLLGVENIEQFEPGKPLECIIIDLATTPSVDPTRRGVYAQNLLSHFFETLTELGKEGVEITKVYAASNTPSGIRIIKHAGFKTIKEIGKGTGRFTFELDLKTTEQKLLTEYREALQEWKAKPKEEIKPKPRRSRAATINPIVTGNP